MAIKLNQLGFATNWRWNERYRADRAIASRHITFNQHLNIAVYGGDGRWL